MRNYNQIQKDITLQGFFSEYLPPCFALNEKVLLNPPGKNCDIISPISFTMSKFRGNNSRRTISIPEIGSYISAYFYMKDNHIFQELIEFCESSKHSFSPILGKDDLIVRHEQIYGELQDENPREISKFIENIAEKIQLSAGAKKILKLDISNCFSSFYMHMIPAILLGTETAQLCFEEKNHNEKNKEIYRKYSDLDKIMRNQNLQRTNGLLTGPLYSKMIVEALLTRVDMELEQTGIQFVRYVDDYEVFLYDDNEKNVISQFSSILKKYGFTLNAEKIEIIEFPYYIVSNFDSILRQYKTERIDTADIMDIFNQFFRLEKQGTKGAIRYLVKLVDSGGIKIANNKLLNAYLLTIMENDERSLTKACSLLISIKNLCPLSVENIKTLRTLLNKHLSYNHDLEVIWLLYLLIKTGNLQNEDILIDEIIKSSNELVILILLEYGLLSDDQKEKIKGKATSWILLYELFSRDIITEEDFADKLCLKKNLAMYKKLKGNGFHFIRQ